MLGKWVALIGAALLLAACGAADIPYETLRSKYASPASRWAELPGGLKVHYRDEGNPAGRPVVLVHGYSASVHAWEPWVARLSGRYRLISLDLPGHGLTEAPPGYLSTGEANAEIVDQLTRKLGVQRFVLAGNSMGGAVAWTYALAHPERLDGLVLVAAAGWPRPEGSQEGAPLVFRLLANPVGRAVLRRMDPAAMARDGLEDAYLDKALVTPQLLTRYAELARAPGHRDILLTGGGSRATVTPQTFAAIRTPTLVMTGEQDKLIPASDSRAFAAAIPGAKLVIYPDGGHVPMEQLPDRSAADMAAWLETLTSPPPSP